MSLILSRLIPCFPLLMVSTCQANPAFFIDTPALLRKAQEVVHATYPDIAKSELVAADDTVRFSCTPDRKRYLQEEAAQQCLKNPFATTPCSVRIRLMLRSTVEQTATARKDGLCDFSTDYNAVIAEFFQDGAVDVSRPEFQFKSGGTADCDNDHTPEEISDLAKNHKAILAKEYAQSISQLSADAIVHPDGYFMVDYQAILKNAQNSIMDKFPEAETKDLHLTNAHLNFYCDDKVRWKPVDPHTLAIPSQKQSTDLCHTRFTFVPGGNRIEKIRDSAADANKCRSVIPDRGYDVTVFSDGYAEAQSSGIGYGYEAPCDRIPDIPSVVDAITQYRQVSDSQ